MNMNVMDMFSFRRGTFNQTYRCFPVSFMEGKDRPDVEKGGKIIMPPSALDVLSCYSNISSPIHSEAQRNIQYPMLFKLTNKTTNMSTHCGVLEFVADEGRIYMPYWMMSNLAIQEGEFIQVESISLPVAEYVKIQPQSVDFLDISNPKAVLERALRTFACLTLNDTISINYNDKIYEFKVLELRPPNAVTIIECDMNVDFAPPVGYVEPTYSKPADAMEEDDDVDYSSIKVPQAGFKVFSCEGNRLDGKARKNSPAKSDSPLLQHERGIPNYDYQRGKITFIRNGRSKPDDSKNESQTFSAFQGEGQLLKKKRN